MAVVVVAVIAQKILNHLHLALIVAVRLPLINVMILIEAGLQTDTKVAICLVAIATCMIRIQGHGIFNGMAHAGLSRPGRLLDCAGSA